MRNTCTCPVGNYNGDRIELGLQLGGRAKKTSRQLQERRMQERRCKRILRER